jgi:hypothetical protein
VEGRNAKKYFAGSKKRNFILKLREREWGHFGSEFPQTALIKLKNNEES